MSTTRTTTSSAAPGDRGQLPAVSPSQSDPGGRAAVRLSVRGVVQGVGFRAFVYSLAPTTR